MRRRTDIISAIVIAALAALLLFWIIPTHTSPPQSEGNLSPGFLPSVAAGAMLVLATLLGLTSFLGTVGNQEEEHEEFGSEAHGIGLRDATDTLAWAAFATAMMVGFQTIGFIATAIPALAGMMLYSGERRRIAIVSVALAVPLFIQQIAWHAFSVQMP
jgi:putative tricarboxylic transport membrane protein